MRSRVAGVAVLILSSGCTGVGTATGSNTSPAGQSPATTGDVSGGVQPFITCSGADAPTLPPLAGLDWHEEPSTAPAPDCTITLSTAVTDSRLELRYQPAHNGVGEVAHRLADLPTSASNPATEQLLALGVGLRSGAVAFHHDGGVSLQLYLATATSLVSVVCVLPALVIAQLSQPLSPRQTAHDLAVWALARQPSQLAP